MSEYNSNGLIYRKSNDLVTAKYKSSLLENQVMAIALTRIEENKRDPGQPLEARLYPGELKKLVSDPAHIYRDLQRLSKSITGHSIIVEDGKGNFKAFSVIPNADYIDGVLVIRFNDVLKDHTICIEKNYTNYELSVMTSFEKNASFRLYELLKKEAYRIPKGSNEGVQVEYNLSELRFIIGVANIDDPRVQDAMTYMGKNIDWDYLYSLLDKRGKVHEEFRDFNRRVLKHAQGEMIEKSDIRFEFETITKNKKVAKILFTVYRNIPINSDEVNERVQFLEERDKIRQLEMPMDIYIGLYDELVGHNGLVKEDIDLLLKKCDFDQDLVRKYVELADKQSHIINYMGWIISAIENNYNNIEVMDGSAELAEKVRDLDSGYQASKPALAENFWQKVKTNEDFVAFEQFLEDNELNLDMLEAAYTAQERGKIYCDWKFHREITF